jgi:hypothetical protein
MVEGEVVKLGYIKNLIKKMTEDVEKESIILTSHNDLSSLKATKSGADEREKQIQKYIGGHPGVIKEEVIKALKNEPGTGYSRKPVLRIINNLERNEMIAVRKYGHSHRLYINKEEILVSLNEVLVYFKKIYSDLIDKVTLTNHQIDISFSNIYELVKGLIILYKTFKNYFTNFFLWYGESNDGETLQKK